MSRRRRPRLPPSSSAPNDGSPLGHMSGADLLRELARRRLAKGTMGLDSIESAPEEAQRDLGEETWTAGGLGHRRERAPLRPPGAHGARGTAVECRARSPHGAPARPLPNHRCGPIPPGAARWTRPTSRPRSAWTCAQRTPQGEAASALAVPRQSLESGLACLERIVHPSTNNPDTDGDGTGDVRDTVLPSLRLTVSPSEIPLRRG